MWRFHGKARRRNAKRKKEEEIERHFARDFTSFLRSGDNDVECILCTPLSIPVEPFSQNSFSYSFDTARARMIGRESFPRKIANQHVRIFDINKETIRAGIPRRNSLFLRHTLNDPFLHELFSPSLPACVPLRNWQFMFFHPLFFAKSVVVPRSIHDIQGTRPSKLPDIFLRVRKIAVTRSASK